MVQIKITRLPLIYIVGIGVFLLIVFDIQTLKSSCIALSSICNNLELESANIRLVPPPGIEPGSTV